MADANLNENLNIVSESGLDIQLLDGDLNIIQKLDDEPNDVGGMTSAELKATFDKAGNIIKDYLNNQLVPAILAADATEAARAEAEAARQSAETGREQAEAERVAAEEDRASAEAARSVWEDYNADKAYVPGNKVAYEGSSYLNISACAGIEPTNTDYWLLIARKGDPGIGDGGGESDVFYAIYGTTTNAEILSAYEAGKAVYMKKDGDKGVYPLITIAGDSFAYFACVIYSGYFKRYMCSVDNWRQDESVLLAETPVSTAVTLSASGWNSSSKTQTVTVSGVLADETKQLITPTPAASSQAAYYNAGIRCTGQSANELTFTAKTIPTADLTVYVTIQEVKA